jgi:CRP-like cAMP-binding protein
MFDNFIDKLKQDSEVWGMILNSFEEHEIKPKTTLLAEGEIAKHIYFIKKGCLRQWFNKDGKDITFQFFFENQPVSSIDSFLYGEPSMFSIESLEHSVILSISKADFEQHLKAYPILKDVVLEKVIGRFRNYAKLFLSRIKDSPEERYWELVKNQPEIISRVPQHYIASYLGITSVSLSRIRNRK